MSLLHDIYSFNFWIGDSLESKSELKKEKPKRETKSNKAGGLAPDEDKNSEAGEKKKKS